MKVTYISYTAVAEWRWNLPEEADDTCGICRVQFEGTCATCKYPGEDCPIIIGVCTHCFHMHCIRDWLASESSQGKCPMCRQLFKEKVANAAPTPTSRGSVGVQARTPASQTT